MRYFKFPDGHVQGFDDPTPAQIADATEIPLDEYAQISTAQIPALALQLAARAALNIVTGPTGQFMRAVAAGISPTDTRLAPWQTYVQALRAIVNGTDTASTTLPTQPAYIQGA